MRADTRAGALVILGGCLVVLLGGVGWITATTLRLERSEGRARAQVALEEAVRLALWRLDSDLSPLLAREATRPSYEYLSVHALGRPFDRMFDPVGIDEAVARSPLRTAHFRDVAVYFQIDPDGRASSPQDGDEAHASFAALRLVLDRETLLAALESPPPHAALPAQPAAPPRDPSAVVQRQLAQSNAEYQLRTKSVAQAQNAATYDVGAWRAQDPSGLRPLWRDGHLLLVRRVGDYLQGFELAWPLVRADLLRDLADILPGARLEPADADAPAERLLASLPVRLEPGPLASLPPGDGGSTRLVLGAAWIAVLVACGTVAALLLGALALGERRAAFVSAVTHELRTPLTTLRTYTEMLEGDMVPTEKRPAYLRTLAREAERLARLVDNVLAYARLERGRGPAVGPTTTAALVARARPVLEERATAAGIEISFAADEATPVRADPAGVEQILFNLVENACKYGVGTAVRIRARGHVLEVADAGPGIEPADRRLLFEPFHRSAERAAGSAPGVGLGLALCRRLARAMGGDLVLAEGPGAVFELRLPVG